MYFLSLVRDNLCKKDSIGGFDVFIEFVWIFYFVWLFLNVEDGSENDIEIDFILERF